MHVISVIFAEKYPKNCIHHHNQHGELGCIALAEVQDKLLFSSFITLAFCGKNLPGLHNDINFLKKLTGERGNM